MRDGQLLTRPLNKLMTNVYRMTNTPLPHIARNATTIVTNDDISSLGTPSSSYPFLYCLVVTISATGDRTSTFVQRQKEES
jgi:hypothetical protein